jgi:outer membrane translocation and assembly module TamA
MNQRSSSFSLCGLAAISILLAAPAHAQKPAASCKLLPVAEIEAALGAKAPKGPSGDVQSVPGMSLDVCSVEVPRQPKVGMHVVRVSIVQGLSADGDTLIRTRNAGEAREKQWTVAGARLEQKTIGKAQCILAARPGIPGHTSCAMPRGNGYVEVDVRAPLQDMIPLETVNALLQKAFSRL